MVLKPSFGNWLSVDVLNSLDTYFLFAMEEPWQIIESKLKNKPSSINFNFDMNNDNLIKLAESFKTVILESDTIVGLGGGTACDTAKFIAWWFKANLNFDLDLILIPSIISVDAFMCSSIAVRIDNKVKYIGESRPKRIIIDYDLIQKAPNNLNRAGVSDTISIASALGDWKLERDEINGKFSKQVFIHARKIVAELMKARTEIRDVTEKGIKSLVNGFYKEVKLCEEWGNARPEEGSEHFLAYCLESITHEHYIHGNLIAMNVLISLFLQESYAEFPLDDIKQFFKDVQLTFMPKKQNITEDQLRKALKEIQQYVKKENLMYSIYHSPRLHLNGEKINEIISFLKSLESQHIKILEGKNIRSKEELHEALKKLLEFPDYYGKNLDALCDCLRDVELPLEVEWKDYKESKKWLGKYSEETLKVFLDFQNECKDFKFRYN